MTHYIQTEYPYQNTVALMRDFHYHYGGSINITNMTVTINDNKFRFLPVNYPKKHLQGKTIIPYEEFYSKYYKRAKNTSAIMKN